MAKLRNYVGLKFKVLSQRKYVLLSAGLLGLQFVYGTMATPQIASAPKIVSLARSASTVCSATVIRKIQRLEELINEDLGNRGIGNLLVKNDILKSALALSHSSSVALTTGFPLVNQGGTNAENTCYYGETDGPPGTIAIATMLKALGKDATFVIDPGYYTVMQDIMTSLEEEGVLHEQYEMLQYPPSGHSDSKETALRFLLQEPGLTPKFDHILALERSGRAKDGRCYNMRGKDVQGIGGMQPSDSLFHFAAEMPSITTSGIGDGGNELGMGKVYERIVRDVRHGETIACITPADYLITAGVSNWGGYAIAVALYLIRMCPDFNKHTKQDDPSEIEIRRLQAALPNVEREETLLRILMQHQVMDGIKGELAMYVDGLPFRDIHSKKIEALLNVIESSD